MTERELAENIMRVHGKDIFDDYSNGITIGGFEMAVGYRLYFKDTAPNENSAALSHWVESAWYNNKGEFVYKISNTIQNC